MTKLNYKERNEELWDAFSQVLDEYNRALLRIGELQTENEILKGILEKFDIKIPKRYRDY